MYEKFLNYFTDYIFVKDEPQKADVIFVPGNGYPQMAVHAAELWKEGFAPYVLPSGRYSTVLGHFAGVQDLAEQYGGNYETEWEFLRTVLQKNSVPEKAILREDQATYTYENALRSREVTDAAGIGDQGTDFPQYGTDDFEGISGRPDERYVVCGYDCGYYLVFVP